MSKLSYPIQFDFSLKEIINLLNIHSSYVKKHYCIKNKHEKCQIMRRRRVDVNDLHFDDKPTNFPDASCDLEDTPVYKWESAVSFYGDPNIKTSNSQAAKADDDELFSSASRQLRTDRSNRSARILSEDANNFLHLQEFDAEEFAEQIFGEIGIEQIAIAIDNLKRETNGQTQNQTLSIAENIHNYAKALENLRKEGEREKNKKELNKAVEDILNGVTTIKGKLYDFFEEIKSQSQQASNASALLSRISNYSFLFKLSAEIENNRKIGHYEEIIRISQKTKQFRHLESIPLFAKVLKTIELSLGNISISLKENLKQMNLRTFNKARCKLVLDIPHTDNPILEMLRSVKRRVDESSKRSFDYSCKEFEDALPFWSVLCDFYKEYNENEYSKFSSKFDILLYQMIDFFDKTNRAFLEQIAKNDNDIFNTELHNAVRRTILIWRNKASPKSSRQQVQKNLSNLLNWYQKNLSQKINKFIQSNDNTGLKITEFLLGFLDYGDLYSNDEYQHIITEAIYQFYDHIHNIGMMNDAQLVPTIQILKQITERNLDVIIDRCGKVKNFQLGAYYIQDLKAVGSTLEKLLIEKLIHGLMLEVNHSITSFFFYSNIDWMSETMEIKPDGWTLNTINRCIESKCVWEQIYKDNKQAIITNILGSILNCLNKFQRMSPYGVERISLNVSILYEAFGKKVGIKLFDFIEKRLYVLCSNVPAKLNAIKSKEFEAIKNTIAIQLDSLSSD